MFSKIGQVALDPTDLFASLEHKNMSQDVSELYKIRRAPDILRL